MLKDTPYPVLCYVIHSGQWLGMRAYIGRPSLADLKSIVRANPMAWVIA